MTALTAPAEPRHSSGGASGAVLPRRYARRATQMVDIPERVYRGSHYSDVFVKVWAKIAALDTDASFEHCNAHVTELAAFTGLSVRDVERALTEGRAPGPDGGEPEFATRRMTRKSGKGRTAIRQVRPVTTSERSLRIPVTMCDALTPRQLRAALLAAHAEADGHVFTAAELAGELFHHHGDNKGVPLTDRTARRLLKQLEELGWIGVGHRAGHQGRNTVTLHRHPLRPTPLLDAPAAATDSPGEQAPAGVPGTAPGPATEASADIHGGSGAVICGGSLAIKEYRPVPTDVVETKLGGGIRRRRGDRKWAADPVDNPVPDTFGRGGRVLRTDDEAAGSRPATGRPAYTGPALQLSPRIWRVLQPVRHELPAISPYLMRRIAREIGAQLDAPGGSEERLVDRLTRRYATTTTIRDIGRWLLGAALVRHGCGRPDCETGVIWETGADCETCAVTRQTAAARARRDAELAERARLLDEQREQRLREAEALEEEQRRADGRARAQLPEELGDEPLPRTAVFGPQRPEPVLPPARPLPPKKTYRQRDQASDEEILAAIAEHGPVVALHIYGHLRTLPLLHGHPHPETGSDRRTHAQ